MGRENVSRVELDDNGVLSAQDDKGRGWGSTGIAFNFTTTVRTTSVTAKPGDYLMFDCTGGHNNPTITLPAAPPASSVVAALIYLGDVSLAQITWAASGSDTILGSGTFAQKKLNNVCVLIYNKPFTDWEILSYGGPNG